MKETELAKKVIEWLHDFKWEVYQEVQVFSHGEVADIVAVQNNIYWVIECKTSWNLEVMAQASAWKGYAHYASIAVPAGPWTKGRTYASNILKMQGIGLLLVSSMQPSKHYSPVQESEKPLLARKPLLHHLKRAMREEHKTWAEAGNANGDRYSPFADTCRQVLCTVQKQPGIGAKELVSSINHHYQTPASAHNSLIHWAREGKIKGVELREDGRFLRFYPAGMQ